MSSFKKLEDFDFNGKRVLVRADLNVPVADGKVTDATRIVRLGPTMSHIIEHGGTPVRAGKYISDNIYSDVVVESGGRAEINLNLDVTSDITARGSVDNTGNSSLGVFFERDY